MLRGYAGGLDQMDGQAGAIIVDGIESLQSKQMPALAVSPDDRSSRQSIPVGRVPVARPPDHHTGTWDT